MCFSYHKYGHIAKYCRSNLKAGHIAEKEEYPKREEHGDEGPKEGQEWGNCFLAEMTATSVDALASINFQDDWIVDSGCGHHLTGDVTKFVALKTYGGNDVIITADDTMHPVAKEGLVSLGSKERPLTLKSVYHVPEMKKNLFFVTNAVDAGYHVLFGPKEVKFVKNLSGIDRDVISFGRLVSRDVVFDELTSYYEVLPVTLSDKEVRREKERVVEDSGMEFEVSPSAHLHLTQKELRALKTGGARL